jgi:KDO2-lipid IV(A) lauroyltransferase
MLLRLGLEIADRVVTALPSWAVSALGDLFGDAWRRMAPRRRRLVAANLARVCAATGRPASGRAFDELVARAFRHHARYYMELLRVPHYDPKRIDEIVTVPDWPSYERHIHGRGSVLVTSHIGNFEPFGVFLAAHGIRPLAPIEEIEPRELFEFLAARRGGGGVELVPLRNARSALSRRLRENGMVGIIGDRLLEGSGHPVTMFGHETQVPLGAAMLAVTHRAGVLVGRCLRVGPDRFEARGTVMEPPATGDRRVDTATLTEAIAARFEADIGEAPEQWWGAFQPFWPDIPA